MSAAGGREWGRTGGSRLAVANRTELHVQTRLSHLVVLSRLTRPADSF